MYRELRDAMDTAAVDYDAVAQHWRMGMAGAIKLPGAVQIFFQERFGIDILVTYGSAEILWATGAWNVPDDEGFYGKAAPGVQIRIVDEHMNDVPAGEGGEIVVRTPTLMSGYHNDPDGTAAVLTGEWYHMGDSGRMDVEGNVYLMGRLKEMINRKGLKVWPAQVENLLRTHPAILQAAVVGIPDDRSGEEVKAFVQIKDGMACTSAEIIAWARERISAHAYPRYVEIVDTLPLGETGKVLKHLLPGFAAREAPTPIKQTSRA
jgi:long-chain acyl-CoA synthetase